jgi:hypothetical protein
MLCAAAIFYTGQIFEVTERHFLASIASPIFESTIFPKALVGIVREMLLSFRSISTV